ncbi:hypothetical protein HMPREF1531_02443 [Propionibacterium sp. oral taxon 192 str. F0372]|uniref:APC family permease n=1 Tax=Propionibacterium sp. oral taxon 192 TaxID=671222 RepID=UPI00035486A9|nr:APC family permease [Propionibacterium sp. oral taxon 192]EPH00335.1 hypothetical protein HMPREF1531_02443 [Propionibacterium sp. oral taxon 192 str. F0372]
MSQTADHETSESSLARVMSPGVLLLFIMGDILGTGIYALTGTIARQVGGVVWLPFLIAFVVAFMTAFSYLELVTKYPRAAGAALYTHKGFGIHLLTFMVTFIVMASGITSASTASRAFAANLMKGFHIESNELLTTLVAIGFIILVMIVNLWGVGHSVKTNVVLTLIELSGLLIVILVGAIAMTKGLADFSRVTVFETGGDKSVFLAVTAATSVAFFAMVGFEDSVNMAEETRDPTRVFPKMMLTGMGIAGLIYMLVSLTAVALVPPGELAAQGAVPLLQVIKVGAPDLPFDVVFPFISMFAVANTALLNMMMASRLLYGMAREKVLPAWFGKVHPVRRTPWTAIILTTILAGILISFVGQVSSLGGTTALLLLIVFTVVNISVLVLRKDKVNHEHFKAPGFLPCISAVLTGYLVGPWTGRDVEQFVVALVLIGIGFVLWIVEKAFGARRGLEMHFDDVEHMEDGLEPPIH